MQRKIIGRAFAAVAVGAMLSAPLAAPALAEVVTPAHQQPQPDSNDWRGGGAPKGIDRHCDRHGNWHNNNNDRNGHRDNRCRTW
ncbi:hypothetical protein [Nocardia miyunensis]|uniref:hypothetical protein n=1 Tax=Nocardia miyunensis TaxID=282684 RepID=UPI000833A946|nr:hypothetical protein [Nocardia miyunensis]